jgi:hypothetical protein
VDLATRFERLQGDKDKAQESKDREIDKLRSIVKELEGEVLKIKEEAAQDRILAHQINPVIMDESSISNSNIMHRGGLSPPEDEADSVEIDLNAIGLPP